MKKQIRYLFIITLFVSACQAYGQDSLATIYFYRASKFAGSFVGYNLKHNGNIIGRVKSGTLLTYQCPAGVQIFSATTESESSIKVEVASGETYYIECGIAVGVMVGKPTFRQASAIQAKVDIEKLDKAIASALPSKVLESNQAADTIRALANLFQRKRKGGTTRAVVFGALGIGSIIGTANYKPTTVTINQGSAGSQIIETSSGPPAINYVFIGFSAIMVVTGITQTSNYSTQNLDALINNYKEGNPLPAKIKSKLKAKDFK
jgi:hypothetical protein